MDQQEIKKDDNIKSVADLEVSSEQAQEIQAGITLKPVYVTSYQTGGAPGGDLA